MTKNDRITSLEREVDALHVTVAKLADRLTQLDPPVPALSPPPPPPSLVEQARRRAHDLGDRVLQAVGL